MIFRTEAQQKQCTVVGFPTKYAEKQGKLNLFVNIDTYLTLTQFYVFITVVVYFPDEAAHSV